MRKADIQQDTLKVVGNLEKTSCPVYMLVSENIRARSMTRMVFPVQVGNTHKMVIFT